MTSASILPISIVYEKLDFCIARHSWETLEYMFMRVLAYCLDHGDGIELTQDVAAGDEPAVLIRDLWEA